MDPLSLPHVAPPLPHHYFSSVTSFHFRRPCPVWFFGFGLLVWPLSGVPKATNHYWLARAVRRDRFVAGVWHSTPLQGIEYFGGDAWWFWGGRTNLRKIIVLHVFLPCVWTLSKIYYHLLNDPSLDRKLKDSESQRLKLWQPYQKLWIYEYSLRENLCVGQF